VAQNSVGTVYGNDRTFTPGEITQIPTLSEWGMIIMFLLTISAGFIAIRRRESSSV